jgi:hypothetical protein
VGGALVNIYNNIDNIKTYLHSHYHLMLGSYIFVFLKMTKF